MISEDAVAMMFSEGFDCSQVVLSEVSGIIGISKDDALKMASPFGIGMTAGSVCGAALGAYIALGFRFGNHISGDMAAKAELFAKREEFVRRFKEANGALMCPELIGVTVRSLDEMISLSPKGVYRECPRYCVNAIMILEDMLQ